MKREHNKSKQKKKIKIKYLCQKEQNEQVIFVLGCRSVMRARCVCKCVGSHQLNKCNDRERERAIESDRKKKKTGAQCGKH